MKQIKDSQSSRKNFFIWSGQGRSEEIFQSTNEYFQPGDVNWVRLDWSHSGLG